MYVRKRVGRRRGFFRKYRLPLFLLACAGTFLVAIFFVKPAHEPIVILQSRAAVADRMPVAHMRVQGEEQGRIVYPYSVIPGGVRSRAELARQVLDDPVVADHYADFNIERAQFVKSEADQFVHVAYRLHDKVFWTAKKVAIPKGEVLISDGSSVARTRCGNRISVLPQEPISQEEPEIESFDIPIFKTPMIASMEPPRLDLLRQPEAELQVRPIAPQIPYVPINPPVFESLRYSTLRPLALFPRFHEVPEPGTISLITIGLVTLLAVRISRHN